MEFLEFKIVKWKENENEFITKGTQNNFLLKIKHSDISLIFSPSTINKTFRVINYYNLSMQMIKLENKACKSVRTITLT